MMVKLSYMDRIASSFIYDSVLIIDKVQPRLSIIQVYIYR